MSSYTRITGRRILFVGISLLLLLPAAAIRGQTEELTEVEELRREVKALRGQVQSLRTAIGEMAELDRQRAAIFTKALKTPAAPEPAPTLARSEPAARAPSLPAEPVSAPAASARRRVQDPPPAAPAPPPPAGVVRGKVDVPAGEPVAYVYVENILEPAVRGRKVVIQQQGKRFVPSWAVVQRGTAIEFPNLDNIYHNVFSLSSGNTFDLGLYDSAADAKTHVFTEVGAVDIYCNIHPQMAASALVVPNRHFAKVKSDGSFEIAGIPRGRRKVVAWSPGSKLNAQWVDLTGSVADVSFRLEPKSAGHRNKNGHAYGSYE